MKVPVIAIGLDAAEPTLIEKWISEGHLKNLAKLKETGSYSHLSNLEYYRAETPWSTFLTGCNPDKTGYWGPVKYNKDRYVSEQYGAYKYEEYPPFYALGKDYKVAIFDMPQTAISKEANGPQVLGWGSHSQQTPSQSYPADLLENIIKEYGPHPNKGNDHANVYNKSALKTYAEKMKIGIRRKADVCKDILKQDDWNLFLTIFGEAHSAGHYLWHCEEKTHPLYGLNGISDDNLLLDVFEAMDEAIGQILSAAPDNAHVIVFSAHGMQSNNLDVPSTFFLPEVVYRWNFPGKKGFIFDEQREQPEAVSTSVAKNSWHHVVWSNKQDSNPIRRLLRAPSLSKFNRAWSIFKLKFFKVAVEKSLKNDLISPYDAFERRDDFNWQPVTWYTSLWPKMRAFALPSFSEGYIRINLKGRDPQGIVDPADYDSVCTELIEHLHSLKQGRSGEPMVDRVVRTRSTPDEDATNPRLPDADLVVMWNEKVLTDFVDSPELGRIGPVPYMRSGSHTPNGFLLMNSPLLEAGETIPEGQALDLAPTILSLMGATIPDYMQGKALVRERVPVES